MLGAGTILFPLRSTSQLVLLTESIYGSIMVYGRIHVVCRSEKESEAYNATFYCHTASDFQ